MIDSHALTETHPTSADQPVPESIRLLEGQWFAWLDFLEVRLSQDFERLPFSTMGRERPFPINAADAVRSMFAETVRIASVDLSCVEGFTLDADHYFDRFCGPDVSTTASADRNHDRDIDDMQHIARARTFSPVAVYRAIAADHTLSRVEELVKQALAQSLHVAFRLDSAPVVMRAGHAVLSMSAWTDNNRYGKGGFVYSCSTEQSLSSRLRPLVLLLTDYLDRPGYLPGTPEALQLAFRGSSVSGGFESRQSLSLTPDVAVVFYKAKIEILIKADVAGRMNAFLGEWLASGEMATS